MKSHLMFNYINWLLNKFFFFCSLTFENWQSDSNTYFKHTYIALYYQIASVIFHAVINLCIASKV